MTRKGFLRSETEQERVKILLECIRLGMPIKYACANSSMDEATYYGYFKKAEKDFEAGKTSSVYIDFVKSVEKAKSEFIKNNMAVIMKSAVKGSWQASAWLLERRNPEEFGLKQPSSQNQQENIEYVSDVPDTTKND